MLVVEKILQQETNVQSVEERDIKAELVFLK